MRVSLVVRISQIENNKTDIFQNIVSTKFKE